MVFLNEFLLPEGFTVGKTMTRTAAFCLYLVCLVWSYVPEISVAAPEETAEVSVPPQDFSGIREKERFMFSIRWLGMEVGTGELVVKGIEEVDGRKAYHAVFYVRSNSVISLVYPVRDEHHTYIDTQYLHSLRYEKVLSEGRYRADEVMEFDQTNHTAIYRSRRSQDVKQMVVPKDVQDQMSCGFWLRRQLLRAGDVLKVPISADEKNWQAEIKILAFESVKVGKLGTFRAVRIEPKMTFQGVFIHMGKVQGWMSADEKRLPLRMKTKIPVLGTVSAVLTGYEGT